MTKENQKPEVGDLTKDGVYIGRFKDGKGVEKDYFAAPTDIQNKKGKRLFLDFDKAIKYARKATVFGHNDWIVSPAWNDRNGAPDLLGAIFNNRSKGAFKGTLDKMESDPSAGWYLSSSPYYIDDDAYVKIKRFNDGLEYRGKKDEKLAVRLVRSVPV